MGGLLGIYLQVPTIHFYGGDHETDGHEDTVIRHATSKLSTFHFVSCEEHKNRLIKIGESRDRIFNTGSIALDKFISHKIVSLKDMSSKLDINIPEKFALLIYHPMPNEDDVFENILIELKNKSIFTFVSFPNTDSGNLEIINTINKYYHDENFFFFKNLNRDIFLTIFKKSIFMIGNSSAGLLESASIPIPVINVGRRQKNRLSGGNNIIFCEGTKKEISKAIQKVMTKEFLLQIKDVKNIFGNGNSSEKAYFLIKSLNFREKISKIEDPLCF